MGFKDFKKKQNSKFKKLPKNLQTLLGWYSWLEYDFKNNIDSDDYYIYSDFRYWCIRELDEWYEMDTEDIPEIKDDKSFLKTWFNLDGKINKQNLKSIDIQKQYTLKPAYDGLYLKEDLSKDQ
jgi:hypothetical protein